MLCGAFIPLKSISLRSVLRFVECRRQSNQKCAKSLSGIYRPFLDNSMPSSGCVIKCDGLRRRGQGDLEAGAHAWSGVAGDAAAVGFDGPLDDG